MDTSPLTTLPLSALLETRHDTQRHSNSHHAGLDHFPGQRTGPRRGQGLEFEDLRQYAEGDDIRHIDWNVTARTNEPYTRLYREEREHTTTVMVDFRPSMYTGSNVLKAVRAGLTAAAVLWQAHHAGDRCAAVTYSNEGVRATRPLSGHQGVINACELLADEFNEARTEIDQPERHLTPLLDWINRPGRSTGTNILFSGLDSLGQVNWDKALQITGVTQRLVTVMLVDPLEINGVPEGRYMYQSRQGATPVAISEASRLELQVLVDQDINVLHRQFAANKLPLIMLDPAAKSSDLIARLLNRSAI